MNRETSTDLMSLTSIRAPEGTRRMSQRLNDIQKDQDLLMRYGGASIAEVADHFGYKYNGMYNLLKSPEMQDRFKEFVAEARAERLHGETLILLRLRDMLDLSLAVAMDPENADSTRTREYLIDKVLPKAASEKQDTRVEIEFTGEVIRSVTTTIDLLNENLKLATGQSYEDHVLEGDEALPSHMLGEGKVVEGDSDEEAS